MHRGLWRYLEHGAPLAGLGRNRATRRGSCPRVEYHPGELRHVNEELLIWLEGSQPRLWRWRRRAGCAQPHTDPRHLHGERAILLFPEGRLDLRRHFNKGLDRGPRGSGGSEAFRAWRRHGSAPALSLPAAAGAWWHPSRERSGRHPLHWRSAPTEGHALRVRRRWSARHALHPRRAARARHAVHGRRAAHALHRWASSRHSLHWRRAAHARHPLAGARRHGVAEAGSAVVARRLSHGRP
mmetsp:Transcript_46960/g.87798  ORF Transcript_46960/g.87798 Transcript_46960/m.87798 type:complete len:240 (-) Transcript_46960:73-792(-)